MPATPNFKKAVADRFGELLDQDKFEQFRTLLADDCCYLTGSDTLIGRKAIASSYEQNMQAGRAKLDKLIWGPSQVTIIDADNFEVLFVDFLQHQGIDHTYRCAQRITINDELLITQIEHRELSKEREKLHAFYKRVGIPE